VSFMNPFQFISLIDPDATRVEEAFMYAVISAPDFETLLEQYPERAVEARRLYESVQAAQRSVSRLQASVRRQCPPELHRFLTEAAVISDRARKNCTPQLIECIVLAGVEATRLTESMQISAYDDRMARAACARLHEELAVDAEDQLKMIGKAKGGATHGGDTLGAELAKEHDTFVRALEKEFKFKAHHWEPVREGVMVFLDQEAVDALTRGLTYNAVLQRITGELGYLMVQRGGAPDDLGGFGESLSKWMFIKCPHELEDTNDAKASAKIGKDREKAAQKLLKEIEKLTD